LFMCGSGNQVVPGEQKGRSVRRLYELLACRAFSILIFAALFCNLAAKLFHSLRTGLLNEYPGWILADVSFLLLLEVILALICFRWPSKVVIRMATFVAAVVLIWSVINAGLLVRTGTQVLPYTLAPLFRDPLNTLAIVGINLIKMPVTAAILLVPSMVLFVFVLVVLARPRTPDYNRRAFLTRAGICLAVVLVAGLAKLVGAGHSSSPAGSGGLGYNCQVKALASLFACECNQRPDNYSRKIPAFDEVKIELENDARPPLPNIVILVLEGIQYRYTSLAGRADGSGDGGEGEELTPYLAALARQGIEFTNTRSTLTHTTKALFALLTGRYPSVSHDLVETIPVDKPYASLATILAGKLGYRTAFFQSAKGNFEARPGLVHNLGFGKFWARDELGDPNAFIGYLGCDEFAMLKPIRDWIKMENRPFLVVILCSVTHDPYQVPEWFEKPADEPLERYKQAIRYTDTFIAAVHRELDRLNIADRTIFCVISDHGEGFGEHGRLGHEAITFEEAVRIPFVLHGGPLTGPGRKIEGPVTSIDLTPTLLSLLGFDTSSAGFDGLDVLSDIPEDRRIFFTSWLEQSPAGYVEDKRKFIYDPVEDTVFCYDLGRDPQEKRPMELPPHQVEQVVRRIQRWRRSSIFEPDQSSSGEIVLFEHWLCRWRHRQCKADYIP